MTTAGIMLGAIVILADLGLRAMWLGGGSRRSRDDSGGGGGAQAILMLVALVFIILSPILAQLIYFALSRRREYLADASAPCIPAGRKVWRRPWRNWAVAHVPRPIKAR
jgi:heat shock protein HtpX